MASIYQSIEATASGLNQIYATLNNTQQNDIIAVVIGAMGTPLVISSVTDSIGNTFYKTATAQKYNGITIYYAVNKGSGNDTIYVNFKTPVDSFLALVEISGINTATPVAGQNTNSGDTINPTISIPSGITNVFALAGILYQYEASATPSPPASPSISPASPSLDIGSIGIPNDFTDFDVEYLANTGSTTILGWQSGQSNLPYWDAVAVFFNLPTSSTSTTPCSSLPFPLNDICSGITSLSQDITSTGQGLFNGLSYIAQAFYNAFETLAQNFVSAWQYLSQYIVNAFTTFGQWIDTAFKDIGTQLYNAWLYLSQNIYNAFTTFGQWIDTAGKDIGTWLYNAFNYIYTGLTQFGNWIWSGITAFATAIINFANWAWQGITGVFNAIYQSFTQGTEALVSSFESGIVSIQNALVNKLHDMIVVSLTMPAEFGLFNAFKDNLSQGNMKGTLGSLGGVIATPVLAEIIATFLSNYIKPQQISKILPRPSLPSITIPTPTLTYSPTPGQTSAPPTTVTPPTSIPPSTTPTSQAITSVSYQVGGAVPPQSLTASPTTSLSIQGASQPASPQSLTATTTTSVSASVSS